MTIPDWQLPPGVDRGLWDYLHSGEMVARVRRPDGRVAAGARRTWRSASERFPTPGRLIDLGCGTGRLCVHFAREGVRLRRRRSVRRDAGAGAGERRRGRGDESSGGAPTSSTSPASRTRSFDYAACLFSTLGMVRGAENRAAVVRQRVPRAEARRAVRAARPQPLLPRARLERCPAGGPDTARPRRRRRHHHAAGLRRRAADAAPLHPPRGELTLLTRAGFRGRRP